MCAKISQVHLVLLIVISTFVINTDVVAMQIFVKDIRGNVFTIDSEPSDTLANIAEKAYDKGVGGGADIDHTVFHFGGAFLDLNQTLSYYNIQRENTINVFYHFLRFQEPDGYSLNAGGNQKFLIGSTDTLSMSYDTLSVNGALSINATAKNPFSIDLKSANFLIPGLISSFDATQSFFLPLITASGGISGYNTAAFSVNTAAFQNDLQGGTFNLALQDANTLSLEFTPSATSVPEPSTYALFGIGAIGMLMILRRKKTA